MSLALAAIVTVSMTLNVASIERHEIDFRFDPVSHMVSAADDMTVRLGGNSMFAVLLHGNLTIDAVRADGEVVNYRWDEPGRVSGLMELTGWRGEDVPGTAKVMIISLPQPASGVVKLSVTYHGEIFDEPKAAAFSREQIADQTTGIVSEKGVYLSPSTCWYPTQPGSLVVYSMKVIAPAGYEVVTEADRVGREDMGEKVIFSFASSRPFDGIHLVAGKYRVETIDHNGVAVQTFFFEGSEELSPRYLQASKEYLEMYEEMLGSYPFGKFAVVENFFPTGYGMPSFTLLGSEVIRLPFIVGTSLGHEIAHNWWGNSVYIDFSRGNWCEGLTVYCADYHYKELEGEEAAAEYRRDTNRDYTNYVNSGNDFALRDFRERHNPASRAVGYGKSMMTFHTIRRRMGDERFFAALKEIVKRFQWKNAGWEDLTAVFSESAGTDLSWVPEQYIDRAGAPFIELHNASMRTKAEDGSPIQGWVVTFELSQAEPLYTLDVPVHIDVGGEELVETVRLDQARQGYSLEISEHPYAISVDPDCQLFRRLHREEIPPVLSQIFGGPDQLIVLPTSGDESKLAAYAAVAEALNRNGAAVVKKDNELGDDELTGTTLIIIGGAGENALAERWEGSLPNGSIVGPGGFVLEGEERASGSLAAVACFRNPLNEELGAVVLATTDADAVASLGSRLLHYGKYSYLAFEDGRNIIKGTWRVETSPLIHVFAEK
jgi:aminopeptidase N